MKSRKMLLSSIAIQRILKNQTQVIVNILVMMNRNPRMIRKKKKKKVQEVTKSH